MNDDEIVKYVLVDSEVFQDKTAAVAEDRLRQVLSELRAEADVAFNEGFESGIEAQP